jgi:hypothetical protein
VKKDRPVFPVGATFLGWREPEQGSEEWSIVLMPKGSMLSEQDDDSAPDSKTPPAEENE